MSVCFSTRSCPSEVRERRERIRRKNVSLSLKKTLSLSLSLFLFSSLSLSLICFTGCRFVFFFPLFCTSFCSWGELKALVFSLFFPCFRGDRKPHHPFVSLSLSLLRRERFGKPDLPFEYSAAHKKREGSSLRKKSRLARESRKKKMDWMSPLIAARTAATQRRRSRQRRKRTHPREQIYVTLRPPPRGMPPKFILPLLL